MGIFSGLFKSRDKPQNRTAGSNYAFFFGGTTSGKAVTERSAMQMTAVYSCVRILSEAVAGLPLHLYKYTDSGGKAMALDHPLYRLLHDEPNPEMSSFVFRETLMTHLLLWGNAYAQIIRNGKNEIVALYPLMPNKMSVDRDENGQLYYTYYRGSDEAIKNKEFAVTLHPSDVLHIPGLGFDGLVGYSPIAMAKNAIGMAIACEEYGAKFFANGAAPGGVLEHPGTIKDPQRVRESWQSTFGGMQSVLIGSEYPVMDTLLFYFPQSSYCNLFRGVAECYAFSRFHDNVGLRDLPAIRHIESADAVVVDHDALVGNAVLLFSVIHLNMVDQLRNHPLCNGSRIRVSPYRFKKIVNVHALALVLFQFQPQRLDLLCVLALLLFIAFGHFGKSGIVDLARHIVLIEPFKEHIQLPVTGSQSVQLPPLAERGVFRHLCRVSDHNFYKVIFVFTGKAGQPLNLIQNNLL